MELQGQQHTHSSQDISNSRVSVGTSNLVGEQTTLRPDLSSSMPLSQSSQTQSKQGLELGYSDISTTNNVSISSPSGEERYAPLYTEENTQFVMTEKHKLVLDLMEKNKRWYADLQNTLTEAECCECFSRAGIYMNEKTFPDTAVNEKLLPHAKEGWELLRATNRLSEEYPQEMSDLFKRAMAQGKPMGEF
jgi:hypothetical protein